MTKETREVRNWLEGIQSRLDAGGRPSATGYAFHKLKVKGLIVTDGDNVTGLTAKGLAIINPVPTGKLSPAQKGLLREFALAAAEGKSLSYPREDTVHRLIDEGLVEQCQGKDGRSYYRRYQLTPAGVQRAEELFGLLWWGRLMSAYVINCRKERAAALVQELRSDFASLNTLVRITVDNFDRVMVEFELDVRVRYVSSDYSVFVPTLSNVNVHHLQIVLADAAYAQKFLNRTEGDNG